MIAQALTLLQNAAVGAEKSMKKAKASEYLIVFVW